MLRKMSVVSPLSPRLPVFLNLTISINWVGIIDEMRVTVKLIAQKKKRKKESKSETANWSLAAKSRKLDKQL